MYQLPHDYMGLRLLMSCGGMHKTSLLFVVTICLVTTIMIYASLRRKTAIFCWHLSAATAASYLVD